MVELVDTYALGAYAIRCAGSNPVPGTRPKFFENVFCKLYRKKFRSIFIKFLAPFLNRDKGNHFSYRHSRHEYYRIELAI